MYTRLAVRKGWKAVLVESVGLGGVGMGTGDAYREAMLEVTGEGAFGVLRREAGVHRVQRVPATESQGRVHTSTVGIIVSSRRCGGDALELMSCYRCCLPNREKLRWTTASLSKRTSRSKSCAREVLVGRSVLLSFLLYSSH